MEQAAEEHVPEPVVPLGPSPPPAQTAGMRQRQPASILPLYEETSGGAGTATASAAGRSTQLKSLDPAERARWMWANVDNLDIFLQEVYAYFLGNGMWCILLTKAVNMATLLFVVGFSTFLTSCIDYSKLSTSTKLADVQVDRCIAKMGWFHTFVVWLVLLFWLLKAFQYVGEIRGIVEMRNFYKHLLNIDETEMQTISWQQVVSRMMLLRDQNFAVAQRHARNKLDAYEIANRIMRRENYLIAMLSKDVLDLSVPLPFVRKRLGPTFTKTLEWNIGLCIMDYAFNDAGQLRPIFLKENRRKVLSDGLRRRFLFAGTMNVICAPFTVVYLTLLYFFRYFNEYHRDPSAIGARQYTPLAEWKMRELNELYHFFERRLRMSYPAASRYVNQFPREKTAVVLRFVAFVAGSFAAVLGIISLVDPELFLGFEITHDRTVLFYIGVFGTILAVSRSMIPDDTLVYDPEATMRHVAEYTHYLPAEWEGKLHTEQVKTEFAALYDLKIMTILRELVSVVLAPFILWYSLPNSCDRIVDFFREYSVHVDGLGYVCSFAVFNFDKKPAAAPKKSFDSRDGKMLKSYLNFLDSYGDLNKYIAQGPAHRPQNQYQHQHQHTRSRTSGLAKYDRTLDEDAQDMERSVMGLYSKMHSGPGTSVYRPKRSPKIDLTAESGFLTTDVDNDTEREPVDATDGGVLGLLNQFYKHADATSAR